MWEPAENEGVAHGVKLQQFWLNCNSALTDVPDLKHLSKKM